MGTRTSYEAGTFSWVELATTVRRRETLRPAVEFEPHDVRAIPDHAPAIGDPIHEGQAPTAHLLFQRRCVEVGFEAWSGVGHAHPQGVVRQHQLDADPLTRRKPRVLDAVRHDFAGQERRILQHLRREGLGDELGEDVASHRRRFGEGGKVG